MKTLFTFHASVSCNTIICQDRLRPNIKSLKKRGRFLGFVCSVLFCLLTLKNVRT
jgi:hypothetical protein